MAFAPDGRLFVCEQGGTLRVIKNGALLPTPFLTLTVDSSGERGLLGVAFDPDFADEPATSTSTTRRHVARRHNRISRFTANGDVAVGGQRGRPARARQPERRDQPQRRRDPLRPRRQALRRRRRERQRRQRPDARQPARQDAAHQRRRHDPDRQPVLHHGDRATTARSGRSACATRSPSPSSPDRPHVHQRRRAEHLGGDQRRHRRRQLRLADDRGRDDATPRFRLSPLYAYGTHGRAAAARSPAAPSTTRRRRSSRRATPATTSSPTTAAAGSSSSTRRAGTVTPPSPPASRARST